MRPEADGMMLVRAELCERLMSLQAAARRLSGRDFNESVEGIKRLAAAYGLTPVVRVADALERAVAEDRSACPRALYLARLQDAIGCERLEESAAEAMLASVSVRLCA
jgi:transcriptional regulator with XRE-family HTH domain